MAVPAASASTRSRKSLNHFLPERACCLRDSRLQFSLQFSELDMSKSREMDTLADSANPENSPTRRMAGWRASQFTYNDPSCS